MQRLLNFIDGQCVPPQSSAYLPNIDPAMGKPYSEVADSDARDVETAVAAAEKAFPAWSRTPTSERSRILLRIADLIESDLDRLSLAECVDTGKPLSVARTVDIPRAVANFRFFGSAIVHLRSECHPTDDFALNYTLRQPRGVVGLISPWNLPLYLFTWKVAPAIAVGNTAVAKPSEITPMTAFLLSEICQKAGLPPGVLNILHGTGPKVGAAIVSHPGISTISFTGGTRTGEEIARSAAPMFKKISLELGGKNPNIIFSDANLDEVVRESLRSSFANQGQVCLCGSRIFVQETLYAPFLNAFTAAARALRVGDPLEPATHQGAVVSEQHYRNVLSYIDLAKKEGGTIRCGGSAPTVNDRCRGGYFIQPTVVTGLPAECRVNREEIFGPVVTVTPFQHEEEVVTYANGTPYGLSASLWTADVSRAHRVAERLQCGTVWVNCWLVRDLRVPFGGMKQSGVGREGGEEALRFFTEPKNVCVRLSPLD